LIVVFRWREEPLIRPAGHLLPAGGEKVRVRGKSLLDIN